MFELLVEELVSQIGKGYHIHALDLDTKAPTFLKSVVKGKTPPRLFPHKSRPAVPCATYSRVLPAELTPGGDFETDYLCDNYVYNVRFIPPRAPVSSVAYSCLIQHICLVFTYNTLSRASWDEVVAAYEKIRNRCKDGVLPFLATIIAAMGEASVSHAEAEAFATQRGYVFVKFSPITGRGICDAVGSLVELAHGARGQYTMDKEGYTQRFKRAETFQALFPS
ncbi:hypothetical protein N7508_004948 [Penicillium antarcticum]|uniref:uncharacterized protein n=1 Tax=Penicillium antarcticum TaxID=416450 RepID=UPI0023A3F7D9|nr:uncharacterized protein N7508_004948 [Penicillium antarcticum]KAJ5305933.1 hypothetical protein N7508_004948 [Penicillium antarcticum]